mmetsp:Transcript_9621/g.13068  ORF Transcript_9621/g.13068 Transcript_9621/m.13068 type:complete len:213 (-) Transcript_9621:202-840(-)
MEVGLFHHLLDLFQHLQLMDGGAAPLVRLLVLVYRQLHLGQKQLHVLPSLRCAHRHLPAPLASGLELKQLVEIIIVLYSLRSVDRISVTVSVISIFLCHSVIIDKPAALPQSGKHSVRVIRFVSSITFGIFFRQLVSFLFLFILVFFVAFFRMFIFVFPGSFFASFCYLLIIITFTSSRNFFFIFRVAKNLLRKLFSVLLFLVLGIWLLFVH